MLSKKCVKLYLTVVLCLSWHYPIRIHGIPSIKCKDDQYVCWCSRYLDIYLTKSNVSNILGYLSSEVSAPIEVTSPDEVRIVDVVSNKTAVKCPLRWTRTRWPGGRPTSSSSGTSCSPWRRPRGRSSLLRQRHLKEATGQRFYCYLCFEVDTTIFVQNP